MGIHTDILGFSSLYTAVYGHRAIYLGGAALRTFRIYSGAVLPRLPSGERTALLFLLAPCFLLLLVGLLVCCLFLGCLLFVSCCLLLFMYFVGWAYFLVGLLLFVVRLLLLYVCC